MIANCVRSRMATEEEAPMMELKRSEEKTIKFTRLPATEPVEIRFQDLSFRASLGFRKGKLLPFYL